MMDDDGLIRGTGVDGEAPDDDVEVKQLSIDFCERAVAEAREDGDRPGEAVTLLDLGAAYLSQRKLDRAAEQYEAALAIFRELGDRAREVDALDRLATVCWRQGKVARPIELRRQAIAILREIGDRPGEARQLNNLGMFLSSVEGPEQQGLAIAYLEQALSIWRELGDRDQEALSLGNLGIAHLAAGRPKLARETFEQALSIAREIGDRGREVVILQGLANLHLQAGDLDQARATFEKALSLSREVRDRGSEVDVLQSTATLYLQMGQKERAAGLGQQALSIAHEIGDRGREARVLVNLGAIYYYLEKREKGIEATRQAIAILEENGGPGLDRARKQLSSLRHVKRDKRIGVIVGALLVLVIVGAIAGVVWAGRRRTPVVKGYSIQEVWAAVPFGSTDNGEWEAWKSTYVGNPARGRGVLVGCYIVPTGHLWLTFALSTLAGTIDDSTPKVAFMVVGTENVKFGEEEGSFLIDDSTRIYVGKEYSILGAVADFDLYGSEMGGMGPSEVVILNGPLYYLFEQWTP